MNQTHTYRIIIEPDENATYHAYVPALLGCHTWGGTPEEARKNIREAIDLYIQSLIDDNEEVPEDNSLESFETISTKSRVAIT